MKFIFDNNLPSRLARALNILSEPEGHKVLHLKDKFPPEIPDIKWIQILGKEGNWVIISADIRITKIKQEKQAWKESELIAFFLNKSWTNIRFWEKAWKLVEWWPTIIIEAEKAKQGDSFIIPIRGAQLYKL